MSKGMLIVTNDDRVLCEDCFRDGFCEQEPVTHFYAEIDHGVCGSCGLAVSKANDSNDVSEESEPAQ